MSDAVNLPGVASGVRTESRRPRPPLLRLQESGEHQPERHATWTELFFDLIFVVAIAQLAAGLRADVSLSGALIFVGLFAPVWWTWTTYAYLADLFDADEGPFRLVLLGAMLFVGGMAATIPDAFHGHTAAFAITYLLLRLDLLALYAWAWRSDTRLRRLIGVHLIGFGAGGAIWALSLLFSGAARYVVWAVAILIDLGTGLVAYLGSDEVPRHRSHMPERFGLFGLIVLGEAVVAVSAATAGSNWTFSAALAAVFGFALVAGLWWVYFARFDGSVFDWAFEGGMPARRRSFVFGYGHLLVFLAFTAIGAGLRLGVDTALGHGSSRSAERLLGLAVIASLLALTIVQWSTPASLPGRAILGRGVLAAAGLAVALLAGRLSILAAMGMLAAVVGAAAVLDAAAFSRSLRLPSAAPRNRPAARGARASRD
jgi:low temperature requirement protein LtrA